jgi:hypothetical protein
MAVIISFTFFNIRIIGNSDGQISSSNFLQRVIDNVSIRQSAIRYKNSLIVSSN